MIIKPKSLGSFVRSLSGIFITAKNRHGLSPKECTVIACFLSILPKQDTVIDQAVKEQVSNLLNQKYQVTVNYVNKFKKKNVITKEDKMNPVFYKNKIIINYEREDIL